MLRYLRDDILSKTPEGQEITKLYYQWNSAFARAMVEDESFKEEVKGVLDWLVPMIGEAVH